VAGVIRREVDAAQARLGLLELLLHFETHALVGVHAIGAGATEPST